MSRDFTAIGRALSAPVRSTCVNLLMDGSSRPASELAAAAGVKASTASEHLAVLVEAGILVCDPRGRQRFYRIADDGIAGALEQLGHLCPTVETTSYRQSRQARDLAHARLCYDHLAGRLGVALTDAMRSHQWLHGDELVVTAEGLGELAERGVDVEGLRRRSRPLSRACPDWTERRPHLAGALGASVAAVFLDRDWVRRRARSRGLEVTPAGVRALAEVWGARLPPASP